MAEQSALTDQQIVNQSPLQTSVLKDHSQGEYVFRHVATVPLQITPGCLFLPLACCPAHALSDPRKKSDREPGSQKEKSMPSRLY